MPCVAADACRHADCMLLIPWGVYLLTFGALLPCCSVAKRAAAGSSSSKGAGRSKAAAKAAEEKEEEEEVEASGERCTCNSSYKQQLWCIASFSPVLDIALSTLLPCCCCYCQAAAAAAAATDAHLGMQPFVSAWGPAADSSLSSLSAAHETILPPLSPTTCRPG